MQDTSELTVPVSKKTVIIRGYVTGLIANEVDRIKATANKTSFVAPADSLKKSDETTTDSSLPSGTEVKFEMDPSVQFDADAKLLELMLISVDGNNGGNVYDLLMNLPKADVDYVLAAAKTLYDEGKVDPKATVTTS